jgi:carboxylesterase type B
MSDLARAFRGIPFAKAPIPENKLRFEKPVAHDPWTTTLKAFKDGPGCMQQCALPTLTCPPTISEDCLVLNVFTPLTANATSKLPVQFFIHGGVFRQGYAGGLLFDGSYVASTTNTIVVSTQYRLGALGYLYSGPAADGKIGGNFGTYDQLMALEWTKTNIGAFGGDPSQVMLYGQSAGAASTAALMALPTAKGLFRNAIMESMPFGLPFRDVSNWPAFASSFATDAGCPLINYEDCVKKAPAAAIQNASDKAAR